MINKYNLKNVLFLFLIVIILLFPFQLTSQTQFKKVAAHG